MGIAAKGGQGAGTRSVERPGSVNLGAAAEGVQEHSMSAQPMPKGHGRREARRLVLHAWEA